MSDVAYGTAVWLERMAFGTVGTDIFVDQIPEGQNGIFVESAGGQQNNYVPISESVVDIYCKNTSASVCKGTLVNIKNAIHRMYSVDIHDLHVYTFLVLGDIEAIQRDLEYAKLYKLSVQVINRDTAIIS